MLELTVESLDQDGRGVARAEGKVVFVDGALPREVVEAETLRRKPSFDVARTVSVRSANPGRCEPRCPHFGVCGGCTLQHADLPLQVAAKQRVLEETLARIGGVRPATILPAIAGPAWGYRDRARLSVRDVPKKGGVLVGFHERRSSYVADMRVCHVLPPRLSELLLPLRALVESLSIRTRLPQIEVAVGERLVPRSAAGAGTDAAQRIYALVLRILAPPSDVDLARIVAFADTHGVEFWLQTGGPETVVPFHPPSATLAYTLPEFDVALPFTPTDFTQVNTAVNRVLVRRALQLLAPQPRERVGDFFCGLGNFTLPIARRGAFATGFEASRTLVARALENARRNALGASTAFVCADLFRSAPDAIARAGPLDRILLDPPREGAIELVKALPAHDAGEAPQRIVYVSCNPATLARDAAVLVHQRGYVLDAAGIVNMFPHTAHVESIALFTR
ncbi:MAG TPA: 23S rRNA (uracil(1939)-C(5))-methyltransferase RlmD [Candidatus Tumulicola sp.]|nr:23S rRNA (uracil(1939)-C(5))-methyltransferase RlmD [Candidatus Tumulicola sp.]